jgi:hypothetical protein
MTRIEIIAQLDAELGRLERARDFLVTALADSKSNLLKKVEARLPRKNRKEPALAAAPAANGLLGRTIVPPPSLPPKAEPQVHRVPPKRRMERRHLQSDKASRSPAALSGLVPAGPVAVSADEARKVQERAVPVPSMPMVSELRPEIGSERSLGSLIQAFERRAGLNGLETP